MACHPSALLAIGGFAVLYRLLTLRDLTNDHFMQLAWAQQLLFGELPGRDWVDPGQILASAIAAAGQWVAPGPFSEAVICAVMLGVAAALVHATVARTTGSALVGLAAAAATIALAPRLYNYPKLLAPAVALWLLHRYVETRERRALIWCGGWLVAATLLRHDLGIYAALGTGAGLVVAEWPDPLKIARAVATTAAATLVIALPYILYVAWSEGIAEHVRVGLEFTKGEAHQLRYDWPMFPAITSAFAQPWGRADSTAVLYYLCGALPVAGAIVLSLRRRTLRQPAVAVAALVMLAAYVPLVLRDPLDQRLPDLAVPLVTSAALVAAAAWHAGLAIRSLTVALVVVAAASTWQLGRVSEGIRQAGFASPLRIPAKLAGTARDGRQWPWTPFWPNSGGLPAAIQYLDACTGPDDSIMLTWSSPEYYVFARRRFAGGHALFSSPEAFATDRDQQAIVDRLERQRPLLVLINQTERADFRRAFPAADAYLDAHYTPVSSFTHYDDAEIVIAALRGTEPVTVYGEAGLPCYRVS
ncbi:MAG: hypothetical protein AB7P99_07240 [Vicinamibacterales bacterium]